MIIECQVCGRRFAARRKTAKYCSGACKMKAHRLRTAGIDLRCCGTAEEPIGDDPVIILTRDEVCEVIDRAHISAEDMSRASLSTPVPLCHKLGRCAKAFEDALRREGL